jgi:hypothetical protein
MLDQSRAKVVRGQPFSRFYIPTEDGNKRSTTDIAVFFSITMDTNILKMAILGAKFLPLTKVKWFPWWIL